MREWAAIPMHGFDAPVPARHRPRIQQTISESICLPLQWSAPNASSRCRVLAWRRRRAAECSVGVSSDGDDALHFDLRPSCKRGDAD
jgi:hypothetical protein